MGMCMELYIAPKKCDCSQSHALCRVYFCSFAYHIVDILCSAAREALKLFTEWLQIIGGGPSEDLQRVRVTVTQHVWCVCGVPVE